MAEPAQPGVPNDVLEKLYRDPAADSYISPAFAAALYRVVLREPPEVVLEVGLAHGASALAMLTGARAERCRPTHLSRSSSVG